MFGTSVGENNCCRRRGAKEAAEGNVSDGFCPTAN